jgi:hypothetical protein
LRHEVTRRRWTYLHIDRIDVPQFDGFHFKYLQITKQIGLLTYHLAEVVKRDHIQIAVVVDVDGRVGLTIELEQVEA